MFATHLSLFAAIGIMAAFLVIFTFYFLCLATRLSTACSQLLTFDVIFYHQILTVGRILSDIGTIRNKIRQQLLVDVDSNEAEPKSSQKHSLPRKPSKVVSRGQRAGASKKSLFEKRVYTVVGRGKNLNLSPTLLKIVLCSAAGMIAALWRYLSLSTNGKRIQTAISLCILSVETYQRYAMMNLAVLEALRRDSRMPVAQQDLASFFHDNIWYIKEKLVPDLVAIESKFDEIFGENKQLVSDYLGVTVCGILVKYEIPRCGESLGGLGNTPLTSFFRKYLELGAVLFQEITEAKDDSQRLGEILTRPDAKTFIGFMNFGQLGIHDEIYYYLFLPSSNKLIVLMAQQIESLQTANIISGIGFFVIFVTILRVVWTEHNELLMQFNMIIYVLPISIIETSPKLSSLLKNAIKRGKLNLLEIR